MSVMVNKLTYRMLTLVSFLANYIHTVQTTQNKSPKHSAVSQQESKRAKPQSKWQLRSSAGVCSRPIQRDEQKSQQVLQVSCRSEEQTWRKPRMNTEHCQKRQATTKAAQQSETNKRQAEEKPAEQK